MLNNEELKRYSRQMILPEIGVSGQEKLKNASVLMIGAGGLGCPIMQYLVAAGVGKIGIIDDDTVEISNLHRQILFNVNDIGKSKVAVIKEKLALLNPHVLITTFASRLTPKNAEQICTNYDIVIDGSDTFETRYLVNDTCATLKKPLVFGSILKFKGQLSVFNFQDGPNYRDIFPEPPPGDEMSNCAEIGVLGVLPGIVGTYMANEAIKIICEIGETLSGKLLTINTLNNEVEIYGIKKQPKSGRNNTTPIVATQEITLNELKQWLEKSANATCIVDVRELYEFDEFNLGGINIPLHELNDRVAELPPDKKLIFCCTTGQRSKMAIQLLKPVFKGKMYNLKNGLM